MSYKIFGTIKKIELNAAGSAERMEVVPSVEYVLKGTLDASKLFALLRPDNDQGPAYCFEYGKVVELAGSVLNNYRFDLVLGRTIGVFVDEVCTSSPDPKETISLSGLKSVRIDSHELELKKLVLL